MNWKTKGTIESYESEMNSAQEKSQAKLDEMTNNEQGTVDSSGFSDGTSSSGTGEDMSLSRLIIQFLQSAAFGKWGSLIW